MHFNFGKLLELLLHNALVVVLEDINKVNTKLLRNQHIIVTLIIKSGCLY